MEFTETGTLTSWTVDTIEILKPLHQGEGGRSRGGAFLCLPNFEAPGELFDIKHGEYRITPCDQSLPHHKILEGEGEQSWGSVTTEVMWKDTKENEQKLDVSVRLTSLTPTSYIRPGFHPYFSTDTSWKINVGSQEVKSISYNTDTLTLLPAAQGTSAILILDTRIIEVSAVCEGIADLALSYGIWSDNPTQYVCIEPVLGGAQDENSLPSAYQITRTNTEINPINISFIIKVKNI